MPHGSEPRLLVLLALRLRSLASPEDVAVSSGLGPTEVSDLLAVAAEAGLARERQGPRGAAWVLTPEGRKEGERLLVEELGARGLRDVVAECYGRFLEQNHAFLQLCTDWQVRADRDGQELNDHTDPAYDGAVIERLRDLHGRSNAVWIDLGGCLERFAGYEERFSRALGHVGEGDVDWFTKPTIDSYHTVWFELHEHLLASLGIERGSEGAAS